jgi:hypothetical protein
VTAAEQGQNAVTFGNGVFMVGRDIQPGTYHTDGPVASSFTKHCYYATLGSDGVDILDNNIVEGPATVIVNSPYFESSSCTTWTKVG